MVGELRGPKGESSSVVLLNLNRHSITLPSYYIFTYGSVGLWDPIREHVHQGVGTGVPQEAVCITTPNLYIFTLRVGVWR